jgi:AcrR family transcriptional regulator
MADGKVGGKRKRISKPQEERLADLLDASAVIFARDGVAEAKVEDITAQADVSKGTFYLYFKSKDEAAAAVWRRYIDEFISLGETILADQRVPASVRLVRIFESLLRFTFSNADLHRNLYQAAGAEAVKSAANQRLVELIGRTARQGIDSGEFECDQPELVAGILYHGLCGATLDALRVRPPKPTPLIKAAGRLAHTIFAKSKSASALAAKRSPAQIRKLRTARR